MEFSRIYMCITTFVFVELYLTGKVFPKGYETQDINDYRAH